MINEEFCPLGVPRLSVYLPGLSPAHRRPAIIRPTFPVGFNPAAHFRHLHLSPRAAVAVHLSSPPHALQVLDSSDIRFKSATWKNGIRIRAPKDGPDGTPEANAEKFEKLAKRNGIKIGKSEEEDEVMDTVNMAPVDDEKGALLINFAEIAKRRGIRVGESTEASSKPVDFTTEPEHVDGNFQEISVTEIFEMQAKKCGVRLGKEGETLLSCVNTSSEYPEDEVCNDDVMHEAEVALEEMVPIAASNLHDFENGRKTSLDAEEGEIFDFEELARRYGIRIGEEVQEFIPHHAEPSIGNVQLITFEEQARKHGIQVIRPIVADVGTQTLSESIVCVVQSTQTSHIDLGIEYSNSAVQVDVVPDAFEEEFTTWKMEENSNGDPEEMSYKTLYLEEYSQRKELEKRLESEMDLSVCTQRSHKQAMEEMKKEVNDMEDKVEKLKKEVKTVKKHKETEIKRLIREKKQQEEDMEELTKKLSLKDAALEVMREVLENGTTQVKELEAKVKLLSESSPVQHCEKCHHQQSEVQRCPSPLSTGSQANSQSDTAGSDGWKVYTPGYRKPSLQHGLTKTTKMDELSAINLIKDSTLYADAVKTSKPADDGDSGLTWSGKLLHQESSRKLSSASLPDQNIPIWLKYREQAGTDKLSDIGISECVQSRSVDSDDSYGSVPGVDSNSHAQGSLSQTESKGKTSSDGVRLPPGLETQTQNSERRPIHPGEQPQSTDQQFNDVSSETSSPGTSEKFNFIDTNDLTLGMPSSAASVLLQPSPYLPGVNSQNLYRYLSSLINNQTDQEEDKDETINVPPPPPGINTIPVPTEMPASCAQGGAYKFGTFDKLMSALRKRFPEHSRSVLITHLKKAKADCGPVGFRGKQISEVVEHVANVMGLIE